MFRQQVTQIANCTCKIIPDKNQYMMFRSPESFSNKKNYFKQKLSLKNHSTSAHKKYQAPMLSQKKSLRDKKISTNNRTIQSQTVCNNFDTQKQMCQSPEHNKQKVNNKYSFKTIIQSTSKPKISKKQPQSIGPLHKELIFQNRNSNITKKIQDYQNDPLDFAKIDVNLFQKYKNRPITQCQIKHNLDQYKKEENYIKFEKKQNSSTNYIIKNIHHLNGQINQQFQCSKNKENQIQNFNSSQKNFNFDKIKDYRKVTIIQRQNPAKKPLIYMNSTNQTLQSFHQSLQKFYPKRKDNYQTMPLIMQKNYSIDKLNKNQKQVNNKKQNLVVGLKIDQSRIQYVKNYQQPQTILVNQSTVKESKSFATTVTNSFLPSLNQNSRQINNSQTNNNFKDHFHPQTNENNFSNYTNINYSSAFNSNINGKNKISNNYQITDIKNERLKTFNDLMTNQNETQSVYQDEDQSQNQFSQVLMSYRKIFQKSGIVQQINYRLLSQEQYSNKYQSQFKNNKQNLKSIPIQKQDKPKQKQVQKQYLTNNFSTNE